MTVSIITPCYRAESTIAQTIESVIAQTFTDWEMIIVDDASDDGSARIIKEYCQKDDRIKYYRLDRPSGSPSMPRNYGIEHSNGKLIAFLDADDVWLPDKLEKQVAFLKNNHYDLVYSYYEKMSWDGKRNERVIRTSDVTTYRSLLQSNTIPFLTSVRCHRRHPIQADSPGGLLLLARCAQEGGGGPQLPRGARPLPGDEGFQVVQQVRYVQRLLGRDPQSP